MPRPRTYDPDDALDAAMHVFWRKGYAEASYDALTRATGVGRKGLYATFGDKRRLFLKALERYRTTQAAAFLADLDAPEADLATIEAVFNAVAEMSKSAAGRSGCLMANTATDETMDDPEVARAVRRHLDRTSARFRAPLERSGLTPDRVAALADYLTGLLQGLFVLAHARAEAAMIDAHVREGLRALRP